MRSGLVICMLVFACRTFSIETKGAEVSRVRSIRANQFAGSVSKKPNPLHVNFFKKQNQRKKVIASALAFPLPFGFLGVHRIYLGTRPYIPLIYVGTVGGCFGLMPLIDFCTLVSNKDISRFQSNPRVFMWVDNGKKK